MNEERTYKLDKEGNLVIDIDVKKQEMQIPVDGKTKTVGTQKQNVVQVVEKDNVPEFLDMMDKDKEQLETNLEKYKELLEKTKNIDTKAIDKKLIEQVTKYLNKDANKKLKESLTALNNYIQLMFQKQSALEMEPRTRNHLEIVNKAMSDIKELLKKQ